MSYPPPSAPVTARRRVITAATVKIVFTLDSVEASYWHEDKSKLNLSGVNPSGDDANPAIVCLGQMFTVNQTTPAEPQHVIGTLGPVDNPIMAWDGSASLRTLVSKDRRLASLLRMMNPNAGGDVPIFLDGEASWEQWANNWKGCGVTVYDKLSDTIIFQLANVKVIAENMAVQARAVLARDVQFSHIGQW